MATVYMLCDYENNPFYVGSTICPLKIRLGAHLCEARSGYIVGHNKQKIETIRSLNFQVKCIELETIAATSQNSELWDAEKKWIEALINDGAKLCNVRYKYSQPVSA